MSKQAKNAAVKGGKRKHKEALDKYSESYYKHGESEISDKQFDLLVEDYEKKFSEVYEYKFVPDHETVKLPYEMNSLDKIKTEDKVRKWVDKFSSKKNCVIMEKLDGMSALLFFSKKKGEPKIRMYSRGSGSTGRDISHMLSYIKFPRFPNLNWETFAVRGELIIPKNLGIKNQRNVVCGLVNQKKSTEKNIEDMKLISFVSYSLISGLYSKSEEIRILQTNSEPDSLVVKHIFCEMKDVSKDYLSEILEDFRKSSKYDIDGIVLAADDLKELPVEGKNPKYMIAFKSDETQDEYESVVLKISWQVTKHNSLKPVLEIEPVNINGCIVKNVSCYNYDYLVKNQVGVGSVITLIRSGDIIPKVVKVLVKSEDYGIPTEYELKIVGKELTIVGECTQAEIMKTYNFFKGLGMEKFAISFFTKLYDNKLKTVKSIIKNIYVEKKYYMISEIKGVGQKSVDQFIKALERCLSDEQFTLEALLDSCFGKGFSKAKIQKITKEHRSIFCLNYVGDVKSVIMKIKGFEDKSASDFVELLKAFHVFLRSIQDYLPDNPCVIFLTIDHPNRVI